MDVQLVRPARCPFPFFRPHQLVTYLFLHDNHGIQHILYNMFALWMFGAVLENYWGAKRFLIFYIVSGIGAAVAHLLVLYHEMAPIMDQIQCCPEDSRICFTAQKGQRGHRRSLRRRLRVSGGLWLSFPQSVHLSLFLFPIKVKWFVLGYAALELFSGVRPSAGDNVAHWAHLGGGLVGLLLVIYWNRHNRKNFY
jgi:membrane associated rhomboid family serine protease